jgi:glycosyltransferase involved in cell wall biosynthesis
LNEFARGSFSVVTINYNMGRYLSETIESVLQNLREGDEYIVVDGGSTDNSVEVIRSYEKHLALWISEPDNGYADALAKGFALSRGEFLCWINSGDLLLMRALSNARNILEESKIDFLFGDDFYFDEEGRVIGFSKGHVSSLKNMMLFGGWTPLQDACFWKRSLYEHVGGINRDLEYAADYDLFLRFTLNGTSKYVPLAFSAFRKHEGQKSTSWGARYEKERERCRSRELEGLGWKRTRIVALECYYWAFVRLRERVVRKTWRAKGIAGTPVHSVKCQAYS